MGESRAKRRARQEALDAEVLALPTQPQGRRTAHAQVAGAAVRSGDATAAATLEAALRASGEVQRATHGFHTYPAGLHPDAARTLIGLGEGPVLDPFCGGGTVLVEAMLAGRPALGCDVSAVATLVARARTALTDEAARTALRAGARRAAEAAIAAGRDPASPLPDLPPAVAHAYEPHVQVELAAIRAAIGDDPLLRAVFSAVLVKASRRVSDTSARLEDRPRPPGTAATLFHAKAREYARMLTELAEAVPPGVRARVHREDARDLRVKEPFGMVVTSPPYPGVYDYVAMQALRRAWLGLDDSRAEQEEIATRGAFARDRKDAVARWSKDTARWVRAATRALGVGGRLVVVIGDGRTGGRPIDAWGPTAAAVEAAGLHFVARVTVDRHDAGLGASRHEHAGLWERREPAASEPDAPR